LTKDCHQRWLSWLVVEGGTQMARREVPEAIVELVRRWQARGRPPQPGIRWPRARWLAWFPDSDELLGSLPDRLDRATVRGLCSEAARSPAAAWQAFLVVMVWGQGMNGYGPWRTARILQDTPDATQRLATVARHLSQGGALDAYRRFGGDCRLRWLGPAFGTKYLSFCPQGPGSPALILDRLVAQWLTNNTQYSFRAGAWSPSTYRRYLELIWSWAAVLGVDAEEVEWCIFQAQADQTGNQWAATPPVPL
jgi:hypothetical protein